MASASDNLGFGAHGVPRLEGKENFNAWRFVIRLIMKKLLG
jgi:hypothetical protein